MLILLRLLDQIGATETSIGCYGCSITLTFQDHSIVTDKSNWSDNGMNN